MLDCIFGGTDKEQEKGLSLPLGLAVPASSCRSPDFLLVNHHSSPPPTRQKHPVREATGPKRASSTLVCHQAKGGSSPLGQHIVPSANPKAALPLSISPPQLPTLSGGPVSGRAVPGAGTQKLRRPQPCVPTTQHALHREPWRPWALLSRPSAGRSFCGACGGGSSPAGGSTSPPQASRSAPWRLIKSASAHEPCSGAKLSGLLPRTHQRGRGLMAEQAGSYWGTVLGWA